MEWVEKYRPKSLDEVAGHSKIKEELKKWVEEYLSGETQKPALLVGPPGCGKTTLAHALANEYGFDVIELNASDKRNSNVMKQVVGTAAMSKSLSGGRVLIILDEVDGISGNEDRGGVSEIVKIIKNSKNPIILTANDIYKPTLMSLRNVCKVIKINPVYTNSIVPVLRRIALKEGFSVDDKILKIIAKHAGGDLRAAINDLESLALGNKLDIEEVKDLPDRNSERSIFDAIRIILKTTHYDIAVSSLNDVKEDLNTIEEWISENLPREYKKQKDLVEGFDYLSKADLYLGRVYKRQYFGLWRFASALMTAGVALSKEEKYRGFINYSRPTIFTKLSKTKSQRERMKKILSKIGIKTHSSTKRAREDLIFLKAIFENNTELGAELVKFYGFTKDEVEVITDKKTTKKIFEVINRTLKDEKKEKEKSKSKRKTEAPITEKPEALELKKESKEKTPVDKDGKNNKDKKKTDKKEEKAKQVTLDAFF